MVFALFAGQIGFQFHRHYGQPVPGEAARYYPAERRHQNIDTEAWVISGLAFPRPVFWYRAGRPLYPAILGLARAIRLFPALRINAPPTDPRVFWPALHILLAANVVMAVAALWIFFAAARRFGMMPSAAAASTVLAGSGFGFSFWTSQAIPEVLSYFSVIIMLGALVAIDEHHREREVSRNASLTMWAAVGILAGVVVLGKELYFLILFGALLLVMHRRWGALAVFLGAAVIPTALWTAYAIRVSGYQPEGYYRHYRWLLWLWEDVLLATPMQWLRLLGMNFEGQLVAFLRAFAYLPVCLAVAGAVTRPIPGMGRYLSAFFGCLYLALLVANFPMPRVMFLAWPIVYFFAWRGIEWLSDLLVQTVAPRPLKQRAALLLQLTILAFLVWLQNQMLFAAYVYG